MIKKVNFVEILYEVYVDKFEWIILIHGTHELDLVVLLYLLCDLMIADQPS